MTCTRIWRGLVLLAFLLAAPLLSGCAAAGYAAYVGSAGTIEDAAYSGLAQQKCGVMVWADNGVLDDYKSIQLDTARGFQVKLKSAADHGIKEAENISWVSAEQILQYQQNHPELQSEDVADVATRLGVTRLIYVEVEHFSTHPDDSPDLARGDMRATVEVIEVANGKGKVAFSEKGVSVIAPDKCPPEGLPNLDDDAVYRATVDTFTSEASKRFVPHEADAES